MNGIIVIEFFKGDGCMKKITFQRARELLLVVEAMPKEFDSQVDTYHENLNQNNKVHAFIEHYMGDQEKIMYILANNFEGITMRDKGLDISVVTPESLAVFTDKRLLFFKNVKNKVYYRSNNQVPGFDRGYHLFDSCLMLNYNKIEHIYFEKNTLKINQLSANVNEKSDRLKIDLLLYDFCFETITKIIGNHI